MTQSRVVVEGSPEALAEWAADELCNLATEAFSERGLFTWVLSGGATPRGLYSLFADVPRYREALEWKRVHVFWGDERHVGPEHAESNYRMATELLLGPVGIPSANVHRILGESGSAEAAARAYDDELVRFFSLKGAAFPRFDLVLLGMGADGHTASLFPRTTALHATTQRVLAPWVEKLKSSRVTLSAPVLNAASSVMFLVAGEAKKETLKRVLEGPRVPEDLPCQLIQPEVGELVWVLDRAAASLLTSVSREVEGMPRG
jgi:6-phosphogluconolactonase